MSFTLISFLFILVSSASAQCDRCLHKSKATYTSQIYSGGCGYGPLAWNFDGGLLGSGLPSLFQKGAGCGACFKVRCKNSALCREEGTPIILTDSQGDNRTDFVLNKDAFSAMANYGMSENLLNLGIVDIEYKRVPCAYYRKNLSVRVESYSQRPNYLAITILYQGGQTRIQAVDIATVGARVWTTLRHSYGAVWQTNHVPAGPLRFGFLVTSGDDDFNYYRTQVILPSDWTPGVIYDTGVQITDIAQQNCYPLPCDNSTW
ncbi:hypothetical protein BVRB_9g212980 [Beta vulgaris subsp. vulgaris]|nr:hypothetical protein BVRB_9g212980 [Beta vulgaris subsp. vulgaris]